MVLAVILMTSPTTIPRTPPFGFVSAVILPNLMASTIVWHVTLFNNGRKCSVVMPEGPPAAPRFADLRFFPTTCRPIHAAVEASTASTQGEWDPVEKLVSDEALSMFRHCLEPRYFLPLNPNLPPPPLPEKRSILAPIFR